MMIVDDEVIIVGSANINQRSMAGNRDTEIAMCAFQPAHLHEDYGSELPRGDIYGLRMGLWAEHTGRLAPEYDDPSSVECARMLHDIGETNFGRYAGDEVKALDGHLMLYPLSVDQKGRVNTYQRVQELP
jgi:phospholipase D1/2